MPSLNRAQTLEIALYHAIKVTVYILAFQTPLLHSMTVSYVQCASPHYLGQKPPQMFVEERDKRCLLNDCNKPVTNLLI